jgi:hypothetical protein
VIVKEGNKWVVRAESGRNMGTYKTKAEAEKRLKQVEMFKHMRANRAKGAAKGRGNRRGATSSSRPS